MGDDEDSKLSEKGDEEIKENNSEHEFMSIKKWRYTLCPDGTNSGKTGSCIS